MYMLHHHQKPVLSSMETTIISIIVPLLLATQAYTFNPSHNHHLLRMKTGGSSRLQYPLPNCLSWRIAVETGNLKDWNNLIPWECYDYIYQYLLGTQYDDECFMVADTAKDYAEDLQIPTDGKSIWIFDIDDTLLSSIPYYTLADTSFGDIPYKNPKFNEWIAEGSSPPLSGVLYLYKNLTSFGIKTVILSNIDEEYREVISSNLKAVGYSTWHKLILRRDSDPSNAVHYKSEKRRELVNAGYRIIGNIGDQWSDLIGDHAGDRTFKIPNPMYNVG